MGNFLTEKNSTKHVTFHMHDSERMNCGMSVNLIITDQLWVFPVNRSFSINNKTGDM